MMPVVCVAQLTCSVLLYDFGFVCRLVTKTYRLINVKSTTPEELYAHKVRDFLRLL